MTSSALQLTELILEIRLRDAIAGNPSRLFFRSFTTKTVCLQVICLKVRFAVNCSNTVNGAMAGPYSDLVGFFN